VKCDNNCDMQPLVRCHKLVIPLRLGLPMLRKS
jgi:hypothetical protein